MEPHELILSEVHMESCPPGRHAWVTEFFYTDGYQPRDEQPRTGCAAKEQARMCPSCWRNSVQLTLRQVFCLRAQAVGQDSDGDLLLPRRRDCCAAFTIHHHLKTPLADVGLQVRCGCMHAARPLLSPFQARILCPG
jgi:hypothetical protein